MNTQETQQKMRALWLEGRVPREQVALWHPGFEITAFGYEEVRGRTFTKALLEPVERP